MTGTEGSYTGAEREGLQNCEGCFFFVDKGSEPGECHFAPPTCFVFQVPKIGNAKGITLAKGKGPASMTFDGIQMDYQGQTMWPNVLATTPGCGARKPKE